MGKFFFHGGAHGFQFLRRNLSRHEARFIDAEENFRERLGDLKVVPCLEFPGRSANDAQGKQGTARELRELERAGLHGSTRTARAIGRDADVHAGIQRFFQFDQSSRSSPRGRTTHRTNAVSPQGMLDDGTVFTGTGERGQRVRTGTFTKPCGDGGDDLSVPENQYDRPVDFLKVFRVAKFHSEGVAQQMNQIACDRPEDLFLLPPFDGGLRGCMS